MENKSFIIDQLPCNENNLALLAVLISHKVKIIDCVSALIGWEASSEILITIRWFTKLLHNNLLLLLFNLENNEAVSPFCLQFQKLQLAVIVDCHSRCCICLWIGQIIDKYQIPTNGNSNAHTHYNSFINHRASLRN